MRPARGHEVDGLHRAQGDDPGVATAVADHADRFHRLEHHERLAGLVVPVEGAQFLDEDVVGLAQQVGVLLLHLAEDAHAQARAGERVAVDHVVGQAQLQADLAHFVLEQFAQRLDQFELHVLRQAADVVVRFDHMGLAGLGAGRLDHVGVDGALGEELHVLQLGGFFVEDFDEGAADDLALLFRVGDAGQATEELVLGVGADHLHAHVLGEHGHHLVAFVQTQQAVVDEHAGQLVADGLVQQRGDHRGVHATGEAEQDLGGTDLGAHGSDGVVDDVRRGPQRGATADVEDEARENAQALLGVGDFRVELHAVVGAGIVGHGGDRAARGAGQDVEAGRHLGDLVAVAHPHVEAEHAVVVHVVLDAVQQARLADHVDTGVAELAQVGALHLAAHLLGHGLHAVADAEQRHLQVEHRLRRARAVGFVHRLGTAGEDDAARREGDDRLVAHVEGMDFAIHADLAHAAGDQLGVLGAEIEDQDTVGVNVLGHGHLSLRNSKTTRG
ncbi:cytosine deaminase [Pseudomonas aeruginosa P47]|nr:cytosine deaminase [Pseudomonas aeruginosa P47]OPF36197.1 cytosine deaminase [Pseudomonas aeruginosa P37]OPF41086.1 cytosine deaminase [Pseudomonas aeruginosa SD9]